MWLEKPVSQRAEGLELCVLDLGFLGWPLLVVPRVWLMPGEGLASTFPLHHGLAGLALLAVLLLVFEHLLLNLPLSTYFDESLEFRT